MLYYADHQGSLKKGKAVNTPVARSVLIALLASLPLLACDAGPFTNAPQEVFEPHSPRAAASLVAIEGAEDALRELHAIASSDAITALGLTGDTAFESAKLKTLGTRLRQAAYDAPAKIGLDRMNLPLMLGRSGLRTDAFAGVV